MPHKTLEARRAYNRKWRKDHPEKRRTHERRYADNGQKYWAAILRKFGLSKTDYLTMDEAQGHVCASCGQPEIHTRNGKLLRLAVDHDHITGRNRGLLCSSCNTALGLLKDSLSVIEMLHQYLRVWTTKIILEEAVNGGN
jgi:hypothetical protein